MELLEFKKILREKAFVRASEEQPIKRGRFNGIITTDPKSWYCDIKMCMLSSECLNFYCQQFWEKYKDKYPFQIAGIEMSAIILVSALIQYSNNINKPISGFIIRQKKKDYGLMKVIEGPITNEPVILIDDIVCSGSSMEWQHETIKTLGLDILSTYSIIAYQELDKYKFPLETIFKLKEFKNM